MATTSIRWSAAQRLVDLLAAADPTVEAVPGWPGGDRARPVMVWVDGISSVVDQPVSGDASHRVARDDKFTIRVLSRVLKAGSIADTVTRLDQVQAMIDDVVAAYPDLDDLDGVVQVVVTGADSTWGVGPKGPEGYGVTEVLVESRLW